MRNVGLDQQDVSEIVKAFCLMLGLDWAYLHEVTVNADGIKVQYFYENFAPHDHTDKCEEFENGCLATKVLRPQEVVPE